MTKTRSGTKALLVVLLSVACATPPRPPLALKEPRDVTVHGDQRIDEYFWLREKGTPKVEAYLRAETAYADAVMQPTAPLQETLYREMLSRVQETDADVPFRMGGFFYYSRTEAGKQYPILCRKRGSVEAAEQVLLDLDRMARGKTFLSLGGWWPSDDGSLLAYATDEVGFRQYDLHVKDLASGSDRPEAIARVDGAAWAKDGRTLFYVTEDPVTKRANQLWRHRLGAPKDALVYEEKDEMFRLEVERSRSRELVVVTSVSLTTTEVRLLRADDPEGAPIVVQPRRSGHEYYVQHRGELLYIRTNSGGRNFRLVTAPLRAPREESWTELVPHRGEVMIDGFDVFKDFLVRYEREGGLPQIAVTALETGMTRRLTFPEPDYEVAPERNPEFDQTAYRIAYESPITPPSVLDVDMATHDRRLLKRQPVPAYDPSRYEVARLWAPAADGVKVPVTLLHLKDLQRDGTAPMLLGGYGSYGISIPDTFRSERFSLVDRGVTIAIAHVRGGGELGKSWHDGGRMMAKKTTFTDFISCAEFLVRQGYTSPPRLAVTGGSAGGLLMGAVLNMRPDLFRAALVYVPFVDVVTTELDETLPLTVAEWEEWGNPRQPADYAYMRSYSPYDNIAAHRYPAMLVRTSYHDSQVMYWEPAKWVARLRATKTGSDPLLLKVKMEPAGHGGASGRYDRLRDVAYDYAFLLRELGAPAPRP